ncbi:class Ib ribonucleoside-diphosphate reductase assembly flavoprotein NrdI [Exiguobacterium sp. SH5S4]|uniref:class Ib ribonucleoside-diphosphate reductase assembly flavoprotein NrdI n=1 Tax=Exiguobacterium sp. SH5S4 TaxID=2510961 RepID=UPI00103DA367|nr:class Ib ribonucleoside-diphosphate reductase assembly flavoprotein NrdI [Exiguobacterium sp. SH5S4]TCI26738.1 class Ib ribonucleoside-diphosphate reductase assembly flavoprotein NrdI [Exiguobacterium sp. SH5S4]
MLVVFDSKTGNVRRFCQRLNGLGVETVHIDEYNTEDPFILITYTTKFGQTPETTDRFMVLHHKNCKGVVSSGNRNWGDYYAKAADNLSFAFGIPVLHKFELFGLKSDLEKVKKEVEKFADIPPEVD